MLQLIYVRLQSSFSK